MSTGTLYFGSTKYSAEYAVEYSYDNSTFYIESVKVKLSQLVSVWWGFTLNVKINSTNIYSGTENHLIDTFDWYDLGISGSADITDTVTVTLTGSAVHANYQFNVASPTSQTVHTGSSGGDDSGTTATYNMYITEGEGTELTVIRTWNEATVTGGAENLSDQPIVPVVFKDYFDITVKALDGYTNPILTCSNLTFDETDVHCTLTTYGNVYVSSNATLKEYRLSASADLGSYITVSRIYSKVSDASLGVLSNNSTIYHFDVLEIRYGTENGYEIADVNVTGSTVNSDGTYTVGDNIYVSSTTSLKEYKLSTTADSGSTITIKRISSRNTDASLGTLSNGASIYHFDTLQITHGAKTGYNISNTNISGCSLNSEGTYTVEGKVTVSATSSLKEYKLTTNTQSGAYISIKRTASKKTGASLGVLSNGVKIYHFDTLEITYGVEPGYELTNFNVSGCTLNSNGTYTVNANTTVNVLTGLLGLVYIYTGTSYTPCLIYIDNGSTWNQCMPYVDDGTTWKLCS